MQGQIFQKNERNGYLACSVLEEKGFMLTFVLRNAVSSTSPSSLFSVLKTFQHIREVKKVQGKYEKHAAPFSLPILCM